MARNLFNVLTEEDIIKFDKSRKKFIIKGQVVPENEVQEIISGAQTIQQILTWKLLVREMKVVANKMIYFNSKTQEDIIGGKMMLYTIDIMEKKLDNLSKM